MNKIHKNIADEQLGKHQKEAVFVKCVTNE